LGLVGASYLEMRMRRPVLEPLPQILPQPRPEEHLFPLPEPPKGQPTIGRSLSFAGRPPFPVVPWTLDVCPCGVAPAIPVRPQVVQPCQGPATEVF